MVMNRVTRAMQTVLTLLFLVGCGDVCAATPREKVFRILSISSHSSAHTWTSRLGDGFRSALNRAGYRVNYENYELGVRYRSGDIPLAEDIELLRNRLETTRYDLIAVSGNRAVELFASGTLKAATGTPLLVLSYRGRLLPELQKTLNMTGIETPWDVVRNARLAMQLVPPDSPIIVLTAEPDSLFDQLSEETQQRVQVWSGREFSTQELMLKLAELPAQSLLLFYSWRSPEDGYAILPRIRSAFSGVLLGGSDGDVGAGSAGGILPSGREQGEMAGEIAGRIFRGEPPHEIPICGGTEKAIFDYDELTKAGIDLELLPPGAVLLNEPPDFFTRNRAPLLYGGSGMMALLLIGLGVQRYSYARARKKAAAELLLHSSGNVVEQRRERMIELLDDYANSERKLNRSLSRIVFADDFEAAVKEMLSIIGERLGADRCGVFHYTDRELTRADIMFEWTREGIPTQTKLLLDMDMNRVPNWTEMLLDRKEIVIPDTEHPPAGLEAEGALLNGLGLRAFVGAGIWFDGQLYGFVGIDFLKGSREFTDFDIHTVRGVVNLFLLASERFQQRERIAESASFLRQIVDNIAIPIVILDLDYTVVSANPSMEALTGMSAKELPGKKCYDVICRNSCPPEWCPACRTREDAVMHRVEVDYRGRRYRETSQPIFDRYGKMIYILKSEVDITELSRQKQELQAAMEQAQAANRAKSYFLATVSHELRTPLNAVIGFSDLLEHEDVAPEVRREYLHSINFAGTALLNLVNDVLDLSKLEADQMNMVFVRTDVAALVAETVSVFRLKAQEKELALAVDCSQLKYPIYIDHLRLRQVILNLVGNAIKFTSEGGVEVFAGFVPDENGGTGTLTVRVSDTGIGISPESAEKVFEPFVQDTVTRGSRVYEGSGLGLAISQRMVSRMGGIIELKSTPGVGSVFSVLIAGLRYDTAAQPVVKPESGSAFISADSLHGRVLLVDDVPLNLKVLAAMLKKLGVESVSVTSGSEALELLERDAAFDLILSDQWMPGMDGFEFARKVAENKAWAAIPVLAVTADAQAIAGAGSPFCDILLKPITQDSLKKTVGKFLSGKGGGL